MWAGETSAGMLDRDSTTTTCFPVWELTTFRSLIFTWTTTVTRCLLSCHQKPDLYISLPLCFQISSGIKISIVLWTIQLCLCVLFRSQEPWVSKLFSSERKSQTMPVLRGRGSLMQAKLQQFSTMDTSLTLNMGNWCTPVILFPFVLWKIALCYMIFMAFLIL